MKDWQTRVEVEKAELDGKIEKLDARLSMPRGEIDELDWLLLKEQYAYMKLYSSVIELRMDRWER